MSECAHTHDVDFINQKSLKLPMLSCTFTRPKTTRGVDENLPQIPHTRVGLFREEPRMYVLDLHSSATDGIIFSKWLFFSSLCLFAFADLFIALTLCSFLFNQRNGVTRRYVN